MDDTWMLMFNPETKLSSMKAQWLNATEEISGYPQCWGNDGSHVLGQRRPNTYSLRSQMYNSDEWELWRCVKDEFSSNIIWKTAPKYCSSVRSSRQRSFSSGGTCSPVFRRQQFWSCSSCSVHPWHRTKRFLAVSNTDVHSSWSHIFKSFRSCNSDFPVVTTNPQKKRFLPPCNRGVSVVKNVYVYRVMTLRNDCMFSFLGWVRF